jgi:hypothetical protein
MTRLYFNWINASERFDADIHTREDEKVFDLEVRHREGGFANAKVAVMNPKVGLLNRARRQYMLLTMKTASGSVVPLLKGRVIGLPTRFSGEIVSLEFVAEPQDAGQQIKDMINELRANGAYHSSVSCKRQGQMPSDFLEATSNLYYWDRVTGRLGLSNIFEGHRQVDLTGQYLRDGFDIQLAGPPLAGVDVEVSAEWTQHLLGKCNLMPVIARQFPQGLVNSISGNTLQQKWWKGNQIVGRTPYKITTSYLEEMMPPKTGALNLYPRVTPAFWVANESQQRKQKRLKRSWFKGKLIVSWRYRQHRREVTRLSINHEVQALSPGAGRRRTLRYHLQPIVDASHHWRADHRYTRGFHVLHDGKVYRCLRRHESGRQFDAHYWRCEGEGCSTSGQSGRADFFSTNEGQSVIQHVAARAKAHLAASARAVRIKLSMPFETAAELTPDHAVYIEDNRLPGGKAEGKVIDVRLRSIGKTGEKIAHITLGVSVGDGAMDAMPQVIVNQDYMEENYLDDHAAVWAIEQEERVEGEISRKFSCWDLVENVVIKNGPNEQIQHLLEHEYPVMPNPISVLKGKQTEIKLRLRDLTTRETMARHIKLVPSSWSAPKQIDLSAE